MALVSVGAILSVVQGSILGICSGMLIVSLFYLIRSIVRLLFRYSDEFEASRFKSSIILIMGCATLIWIRATSFNRLHWGDAQINSHLFYSSLVIFTIFIPANAIRLSLKDMLKMERREQ